MKENPTVEFGGGLGDVILSIYRRDAMEVLDAATRPHNVLVVSNNPHAMELFRWHPNNGQFVLFDLHHKCLELQAHKPDDVIGRIYQFLDLPLSLRTGRQPATRRPVFHSVDAIASAGHLVFQPYAGSAGRWLPAGLIENLLQAFSRLDRTVYVITRSYIRLDGPVSRRTVHPREAFPFDLPHNVIHLDSLSVPATLQLIRDSAGFLGAHSSMVLAAWEEAKPTAVFYNRGNVDFVNPGQGYSFGAKRPDCYHSDFENADVTHALQTLTDAAGLPVIQRAAMRSRGRPDS